MNKTKVAVVRCDTYADDKACKAIREGAKHEDIGHSRQPQT